MYVISLASLRVVILEVLRTDGYFVLFMLAKVTNLSKPISYSVITTGVRQWLSLIGLLDLKVLFLRGPSILTQVIKVLIWRQLPMRGVDIVI